MKSIRLHFILVIAAVLLIVAAPGGASATGQKSCEHHWTLVSSTPATCTKAGKEKYRCDLCGKKKTKKLKALGHEWGRCEMIRQQTCTEDGLIRCYCTRNENHHDDKILPALGHDWGIWIRTKAPTMTQPGTEQHTCKRCNAVERRQVPALVQWKEYALKLFAFPKPQAADGMTGNEGYELAFDCSLINTGKEDLWIRSWSVGEKGEKLLLEEPLMIPAGQWAAFPVTWKVTGQDIPEKDGVIQSILCFYGETENGEQVCSSDAVTVETRMLTEQGTLPSSLALEITLTDTSSPKDAAGYQNGEEIRYTVSVANPGDQPIAEVTLRLPGKKTELLKDLQPGETRVLSFSAEITLEDINNHYIALQCDAWMDGTDQKEMDAVHSNLIIFPVIVRE